MWRVKLLLKIIDEFSELKELCVCKGESIPDYENYSNSHPEFNKYHILPWCKNRILEQQEKFFLLLEEFNVLLHFLAVDETKPWQMYTRDTGFVAHDILFYSEKRNLPDRYGEIDILLESSIIDKKNKVVKILGGSIEGGDVLMHDGHAFVGISARTSRHAALELSNYLEVTMLDLGSNIMHLDTTLSFLPRAHAVIYPPAFTRKDLELLGKIFRFIEINLLF